MNSRFRRLSLAMRSYFSSLKLLLPSVFGFNRLNLAQSAHMPLFLGERSIQIRIYQVLRQGDPNDTRSQDENVHIIMLHALVSRVRVMTNAGTNSGNLVCCDRNPNTA